uniref:VWFA domain-containing protein n=1 Tax=Branchiostoma floridae TaxID=7739 RepID=C3YTT0_BRAFL|eukprot:XP_002600195.1 hypothetical protein BRAFLDRAFT_66700 [Branchiostoma floridae]
MRFSLVFISAALVLLSTAAFAWLHDTTAVDCIQSQWSGWSNVGVRTQRRTRVTLRYASHGGDACGPIEETKPLPAGETITTADTSRSFDNFFLNPRPAGIQQRMMGLQRNPAIKRDLLIILDDSGSIGFDAFQKAKASIATVLDYICPGIGLYSPYHQVALMTFHSTPTKQFDFNDHGSYAELKEAILAVPYEVLMTNFVNKQGGPRTDTHEALDYARTTMFTSRTGLRPGSLREVLLLTDGQPNEDDLTVQAAERLRNSGITVFALGIADGVDNEHLEQLVSDPEYKHIFHLNTFEDLADMVANVEEAYDTYGRCVSFNPFA